MRRLHVPALFCLCFALPVAPGAAQPPWKEDPSKIVISPKSAGAKDPLDRPGFIVIRPNGRPPAFTPSQPAAAPQPKQPAELAAGGLAVPPPTDKLDADAVFDYWFAATVDGKRIGYVQWGAKKVKKGERELLVQLHAAPSRRRLDTAADESF